MITVGIERLAEFDHLFSGKRVGLITNPTGVTRDFTTTIELMHRQTNLVCLFSPEHGVRGDLQAGERLDDSVDEETGCKVYSLYGNTKKPTKEMMDQIDILAFDMQDVGARFYTYLYTMAYALMACKEFDKPFVVFDRPNPVNAVTVEGNILQEFFGSFVGNYHLPQRYGLTIGELVMYFNEELNIHADLHVVSMIGYQRTMSYHDTGFPWVLPSPNIPTKETPYYYLSTCIFEGTNMSEGRGTTKPFQIVGSPYLDSTKIIKLMRAYDLPGIDFRSLYFTPTFSKHQGVLCHGIELYITDYTAFQPVLTGMILAKVIEQNHPEFCFNPPYKEGLRQMIDLLNGDDFIRTNRLSIKEIAAVIEHDSAQFTMQKRRYHIYE